MSVSIFRESSYPRVDTKISGPEYAAMKDVVGRHDEEVNRNLYHIFNQKNPTTFYFYIRVHYAQLMKKERDFNINKCNWKLLFGFRINRSQNFVISGTGHSIAGRNYDFTIVENHGSFDVQIGEMMILTFRSIHKIIETFNVFYEALDPDLEKISSFREWYSSVRLTQLQLPDEIIPRMGVPTVNLNGNWKIHGQNHNFAYGSGLRNVRQALGNFENELWAIVISAKNQPFTRPDLDFAHMETVFTMQCVLRCADHQTLVRTFQVRENWQELVQTANDFFSTVSTLSGFPSEARMSSVGRIAHSVWTDTNAEDQDDARKLDF